MPDRSADSPSSEPARPGASAERPESVIGPNLRIIGSVDSGGGVRIEGRIDGDVACRTLTIGRSGVLAGSAAAESAEIEGTVEGNITAENVVLGETAQVSGEIAQQMLVIHPGALFEGSVRRMGGDSDPGK